MNKVNQNFLDDGDEQEQHADSDVDEVVEEIIEEVEEEEQEATETNVVLNKAMERIEQAKLYEALLHHKLFGEGSARPEVIKTVRKEVKEFIQFRLEVLLGIRADGKVGSHMAAQPQQVVVKSPFSEDEIAALRALANKLISKGTSPSINSVNVPQPQIQELAVEQSPTINEVAPQRTATTRTVTRRVVKRNGVIVSESAPQKAPAQPAKAAPRPKRQATNNTDKVTGQDYGQAANPLRPPVPMPSQSQMDNMNANLADQNLRGQTKKTSGLGQAMEIMLRHGG